MDDTVLLCTLLVHIVFDQLIDNIRLKANEAIAHALRRSSDATPQKHAPSLVFTTSWAGQGNVIATGINWPKCATCGKLSRRAWSEKL